MQPKFPIWLLVISVIEILVSLALVFFGMVIKSAFSGQVSLDAILVAVIGVIVLIPLLCLWLARKQWHAGRNKIAILTACAPMSLFLLIGVVLEINGGITGR